jgi:hypothetical protein
VASSFGFGRGSIVQRDMDMHHWWSFVEESVSVAKKLNIDCVTFSVCVLS